MSGLSAYSLGCRDGEVEAARRRDATFFGRICPSSWETSLMMVYTGSMFG
jgi:hypothetical protein